MKTNPAGLAPDYYPGLQKGGVVIARVSIVIPTYNEAENIRHLIEALEALPGDFYVVIVDDNSPDGTAEVVEGLRQRWGNIVVHRRPGKLGVGSAIRKGMEIALSFQECQYVVTMDADLSHDPQDVPRLLKAAQEGGADLIQGSRYTKGGKIIGWNLRRKLQSRAANLMCRWLFGLPNEVTTYFRVYTRRSAQVVVKEVHAQRNEFAVASALAIRDRDLKIREVPITLTNRSRGKSKLKTSDVLVWLAVTFKMFLSRQLYRGGFKTFLKFCLVGASGILVNMGLLWMLTEFLGLFYAFSAVFSIEASILTNFTLNELWTFRDRRRLGSNIPARALKYNLICVIGLALNLGVLTLLTEAFGMYYLISNLFGIAVAALWNYSGSTRWAWKIRLSSKG